MARRDLDLRSHSERVAGLAGRIWQSLNATVGQPTIELADLTLSGLLHDIGKLALPDRLLRKPGPLTSYERKLVRTHPDVGAHLLAFGLGLPDLAPLVRFHHERWDGQGYPCGLEGTAIPLGARVLAVADAWDCIRTPRPYRAARPAKDAKAELIREAGRQFDPGVVQVALVVLGMAHQ